MKLVASDLDGTLLNAVGEVSSENAAAIRKLQQQGIHTICSRIRKILRVCSKAANLSHHLFKWRGDLF
ncbi:hypothetical protein BTR23_10830 [Alkalihalophilus pseudofirmus]|nr:hypothetical protein BTR23_10830 [Alkalihalophilus pseudofirmus]